MGHCENVPLGLVGDFQLMFVCDCIPLVGCGGPSGAGSLTLSSYSLGIRVCQNTPNVKNIFSYRLILVTDGRTMKNY